MGDPLVYSKSCPWAYLMILDAAPPTVGIWSSVPAFCSYGSRPMCNCLNRIFRSWPHGPFRLFLSRVPAGPACRSL